MEKNEIIDDEIIPLEENQVPEIEEPAEDSEISFEDLGLDETTLSAIEKKGFKIPSPIQVLAIPRLLNGDSNLIARARTGTGKTAAFGLPLIQKLRERTGNVRALVLEPTRELAVQTCTELQSFTEGKYPQTCVLYGGASYSTQIRDLKRGAEIVVGTPGRIQDHIERGTLDLSKIEYFILDEGDEMLDMGFIDDIEAIFEKANPASRILLFSATMPEPILKIAGKFMGDYEIVEEEGILEEPLLIDQKYWVLKESEKIDALVRLIDIADDFYGLVFTQTKNDADNVTRALDEKGFEAAALHGDIAQNQREKVLARFRSKKTRILVATDVAARGIDISGLSHVVNYSLPFDGATYVHRIGRTGRAGSAGIAVTFVCPNETRKLGYLMRAVKKASKGELVEEKIPAVEQVIEKKRERIFFDLKAKLGLTTPVVNETAENQNKESEETPDNTSESEENREKELLENLPVTNMTDSTAEEIVFSEPQITGERPVSNLTKAGEEFVKMAAELCEQNQAEDVLASVLSVLYAKELDKSRYGKIWSKGTAGSNPDQTRIFVQLGKRDGYNARSIADFFSDLLHIPGRLVDRIDMSSNFSLVSLPKNHAKRALELSKSNGKLPHMHVDIKESTDSDDFGGSGRRRGGRGRGGFGGENRGFDRNGGRGRERDHNRGGRDRGFESHSSKSRSSRPNFHTPTERKGGAGLYKKSKGKAERF